MVFPKNISAVLISQYVKFFVIRKITLFLKIGTPPIPKLYNNSYAVGRIL